METNTFEAKSTIDTGYQKIFSKAHMLEDAALCSFEDMCSRMVEALKGSEVQQIGRFSVYSFFSPEETVVFVHDPRPNVSHKYVQASSQDGRHFTVAAPERWLGYHSEIVELIGAAARGFTACSGGGYVRVSPDGELRVFGESVSYGPGDHESARAALIHAMANSLTA